MSMIDHPTSPREWLIDYLSWYQKAAMETERTLSPECHADMVEARKAIIALFDKHVKPTVDVQG